MNKATSPTIQLFITGGTIDKQYQTTTGKLIFPESHMPQLLQEANCSLPIQIDILMQKDSLEMTDFDREIIVEACTQSSAQKIVITHGTDTMVKTALKLTEQADLQDKTIILTGAMRPYMLGHSDASFNMGSALMAVQLSKSGVYIVMNGQLFNALEVKKDLEKGIFTAL